MIKAKDIQRIITANETAQEASIKIKEMVDNYVEQQLKNCNMPHVSKSACEHRFSKYNSKQAYCVYCGIPEIQLSQAVS